jgi:hypothetical protein
MGFDQPHYRLRQTESSNIGVEEDRWKVGFGDAAGDPLDHENKLGGIRLGPRPPLLPVGLTRNL